MNKKPCVGNQENYKYTKRQQEVQHSTFEPEIHLIQVLNYNEGSQSAPLSTNPN